MQAYLDDAVAKISLLQENLEKVIKGKPETIKQAVTTLIANGHLLIEDVPGVGKTTLAHGLARSINCNFQRIQFTSDLLPSDIIGITIYNQERHVFEFKPGPIFAHIVLADEINRTSPKTQSSLLEAMNDRQVSVDKITYPLPKPFMVIATQNPLEYEGTYPLPESQLDRFMMRIRIGYPQAEAEKEILLSPSAELQPQHLNPVLSVEEVIYLQSMVDKVKMDDDLVKYILAIVDATRKSDNLRLGVSPRGAMALYRTAQAFALVGGRTYCTPDDIKRLSLLVFSHRIITAKGIEGEIDDAEGIIQEIVEKINVPL
ncbi:MAG: MoxR family ATPase [Deltaproteobacteria bacterium]|nr:MoxR family ATPase [Deltaproteobacteria bacterium]MBI3755850.1 MoxR family ATPase [Deltaproteobacteria bacterium]